MQSREFWERDLQFFPVNFTGTYHLTGFTVAFFCKQRSPIYLAGCVISMSAPTMSAPFM